MRWQSTQPVPSSTTGSPFWWAAMSEAPPCSNMWEPLGRSCLAVHHLLGHVAALAPLAEGFPFGFAGQRLHHLVVGVGVAHQPVVALAPVLERLLVAVLAGGGVEPLFRVVVGALAGSCAGHRAAASWPDRGGCRHRSRKRADPPSSPAPRAGASRDPPLPPHRGCHGPCRPGSAGSCAGIRR